MAEWNGTVHPFFYGVNAGAYTKFVIGGGGNLMPNILATFLVITLLIHKNVHR